MFKNQSIEPLVSIACISFNQSKYISETIESFLMQKTDFTFEIIIHDDASTDGTAQIVEEYELRYPNLIFPVYQVENQYSKGVRRILANFVLPKCRGKYIALCEGDDYWTDPFKLQKQVDFLDENEDFGMVHTNYRVVDADNQDMCKYNRNWPSGYIFDRVIKGKYGVVTPTVVFRNQIYKIIEHELANLNFKMGDKPMWIEFSRISKIKYIDEITTSYRVLPNSASHSDDIKKTQDFYEDGLQIKRYYYHKYNLTFDEKSSKVKLYGSMIKECYKKNNFSSAIEYYKKMINEDVKSIFYPTPLLFLLGSRFEFFRNAIALIYKIKD